MAQANTVTKEGQQTTTIILDPKDVKKAQLYWQSFKANGKKDRKQWEFIGKVGLDCRADYLSKHGKAMTDNDFGVWRDKTFPGIRKDIMSYAMRLHENFDEVEKYALEHCPDLSTPAHLMKRFNAYKAGLGKKGPRTSTSTTDKKDDKKQAALTVTHTDGKQETLNFQALDATGKLNMAIVADSLITGINVAIEQIKAGHGFDNVDKAKLKSALKRMIDRLA